MLINKNGKQTYYQQVNKIPMDLNDEIAIARKLRQAGRACDKCEYKKATELYKDVLRIEPDNLVALVSISHCFLQLKMLKDAERHVRKAYEIRDDDDMVVVNYSCVLSYNGDIETAIKILEEEIAYGSGNPIIYNNLG